MRLFKIMKDGGPMSRVYGLFLVEIKRLFSIVVLRFDNGARDAYHTHAFNAWSWVLKGKLIEIDISAGAVREYTPSWRPIFTPRECFHKVVSQGTTWAVTFRGPWADKWVEYRPDEKRTVTLTHGRQEVA